MTFHIIGNTLVEKGDHEANSLPSRSLLMPPYTMPDGVTPLPPIGFGLPLTIDIRYAYTGNVGCHSIIDGVGDVAIVSGVKNWGVFAASVRALNYVVPNTGRFSPIGEPGALINGTQIIAYQRAVTTSQLTATVEIFAAPRDGATVKALGSAFTAAAGIPLLMPYAGYLISAGRLLPFSGRLASLISGKGSSWSRSFNINFGLPGTLPSVAEFRLLSGDVKAHAHCTFQPEVGLIEKDGTPYRGPAPYLVVAIYGGLRPELDNFSPAVAGAAILQRFAPSSNDLTGGAVELIETARDLLDLTYRRRIEALHSRLKHPENQGDLEDIKAKISALSANISDSSLIPLLTREQGQSL